jgi:hypothetical protein
MRTVLRFFACAVLLGAIASPSAVAPVRAQESASLFVSPSTGSFVTGSTFTLSVYLNSGGADVNALDIRLKYPPDKLQVVSPTSGKSFVEIWLTPPTYDNQAGTLSFQGAIPTPGINTSRGLVAQVTFRAVGVRPVR